MIDSLVYSESLNQLSLSRADSVLSAQQGPSEASRSPSKALDPSPLSEAD